jgi:hypothetical protein
MPNRARPFAHVVVVYALSMEIQTQRTSIADSFCAVWAECDDGTAEIDQAVLFYGFSVERHVPAIHLLRSIDRFFGGLEPRSAVLQLHRPGFD